MKNIIREMRPEDKETVIEMMRTFYASPAVFSNGSEEIFNNDVEACLGDSPYLEGYILGDLQGYAMVAKSFSTEFGKRCIWIEDIYLREEARGQGLGTAFLTYIAEKYAGCLLRLEAEEENERAVQVYKKCGFTELPYMEMMK